MRVEPKSISCEALPGCLQDLIRLLPQKRVDEEALALTGIIDAARIDFEQLYPLGAFDHDPALSYGRRCLWQGDHAGVYLMAWNPGDFTALHGHGRAEWGAVVFGGETVHRRYRVEDNRVSLLAASTVPAGKVLGVCRGDYYHAMGNHGNKPFLTLHIYGAYGHQGVSTDDARVFELEKNQISTTGGSAYLNMRDEHRKTVIGGIQTNRETYYDYLACIRPFYERIGESV